MASLHELLSANVVLDMPAAVSVLTPEDKHPSVGTVVGWAADSGSFPAHEQLCNYIFMLLEIIQLDLCGSFQRLGFTLLQAALPEGKGDQR